MILTSANFALYVDRALNTLASHRFGCGAGALQVGLAPCDQFDGCAWFRPAQSCREAGYSMRMVGPSHIICIAHCRPMYLDKIRLMQFALDLSPDRLLLILHPSADHFLSDLLLLSGQIGSPQLRRIQARILHLLITIPVSEILAEILAHLHAVGLCIARFSRQLL